MVVVVVLLAVGAVLVLGLVVAVVVPVLVDVELSDGNLPVDFFHSTMINVMIGILKVVFT
jgi:hypothetical protein